MGPASIEGYYDEAISVVGLLDVMSRSTGYNAAILACFDDTGLDAARCVSERPVLGIGEAAFHIASLIAGKFSVVATLPRSIPAIEHNLVRYGLASPCARVRAADVPVLELESEDSETRRRISYEIELAKVQDRAEAIVLGCAGMADLAAGLSVEHDPRGRRRRCRCEVGRGHSLAWVEDVQARRLCGPQSQNLHRHNVKFRPEAATLSKYVV